MRIHHASQPSQGIAADYVGIFDQALVLQALDRR